MRAGRQSSVDAPESLAGGVRVHLSDKPFIISRPNPPTGIVESSLHPALRHLSLGGRVQVVHLGTLAGIGRADRCVAGGIALTCRRSISRGRKLGGILRSESFVKDAESAAGRWRVEFRRPRVKKLGTRDNVIGHRTLHHRTAPIPYRHAGVELFHRAPIHAQFEIELEIGFFPCLIHLVDGEKLGRCIHGKRLERVRHVSGFRQMVPANLSAILRAESGRHIGRHPVLLDLIGRRLDILKEQRNLRSRAVLEGLVINIESPQPIIPPIVGANLILRRYGDNIRAFVRLFVPRGAGIHANERNDIRQMSRNVLAQMFAKRLHHFFKVDFKIRIQIVSVSVGGACDLRNACGENPRRHGRRGNGLDLDEKSLVLIEGELQQAIQRCPVKGVAGRIDCRPLRRIFLPPGIGVLANSMPACPVPDAIGCLGQPEIRMGRHRAADESCGGEDQAE